MAPTEDEQAVQTFAAHGADPPFGDRIGAGRADRRAHHAHTFGREHGIERRREFGIPVAEQQAWPQARVGQVPGRVARLLRDLGGGRVLGAAGEEHPPGPELDEEEDVEDLQADALDRDTSMSRGQAPALACGR